MDNVTSIYSKIETALIQSGRSDETISISINVNKKIPKTVTLGTLCKYLTAKKLAGNIVAEYLVQGLPSYQAENLSPDERVSLWVSEISTFFNRALNVSNIFPLAIPEQFRERSATEHAQQSSPQLAQNILDSLPKAEVEFLDTLLSTVAIKQAQYSVLSAERKCGRRT